MDLVLCKISEFSSTEIKQDVILCYANNVKLSICGLFQSVFGVCMCVCVTVNLIGSIHSGS